ncbi:MAG: MFS transporter [Bacteroidales bacterium]|nr:MFS transporter [Bacteroidales bacterium]MBD5246443.1 MFS transporter [Barnesiella sp.]
MVNSKEEKLWNSNYLKVLTCNFLLFFAFYLLTPLLPIYLDAQFNADKDMIGLVLSGYVVATLLVRPFSGFIVDSFNRRKVLTLCFFVFFIIFAGYIGAGTLLMFAIVRTVHGIPFGASTVANSTVAIDVLPSSRRNEGIGFYGLSNNLAMAIAPSTGIWIYSISNNFALLFWISLIIALVGFMFTMWIKIPQREIVANKPVLSLDHFFLTKAWLMAINISLFGLCWGVMGNYVAIYGQEMLNITDGTGLFFMILSAGLMSARIFGRKQLKSGKITQSCTAGVILSCIGYALFGFSMYLGAWSYYLSALFVGLGNGQMYPSFLNMFIQVARHDQRGTANSSILISWDLGMGLGILLGGFIAQYTGYAAAFLMVAGVQIAGALMFILFTASFFTKRKLHN